LMGFVGSAFHPMKKWPQALLWAFAADKYDASEWMLRIISEVWNLIVASPGAALFFQLLIRSL
jgi:hypothetical protein